jgi:hypothetical protein
MPDPDPRKSVPVLRREYPHPRPLSFGFAVEYALPVNKMHNLHNCISDYSGRTHCHKIAYSETWPAEVFRIMHA